ncbi:PilZ domain-containing protein [Vibrio ziniensis]|uniref:PilZ domain-containing protein n=1 Tax=Vibrio ziniensis TaxID=2711221 RepID=A0A6G7CHN2_9VIBR|nr:PilZ domain-containing protein [Vibrio ziniensis]QIH41599.1 PilZ domain-containing protein [Vibrio ziniensis]
MSATSFINRRKSTRTELETMVPASCLFNRWFKPVIKVQIVDVSNHGMKIFSSDYLKLSNASIRIDVLGETVKGKIVWRTEREGGYMCGFLVQEGDEISDEDIENLGHLQP